MRVNNGDGAMPKLDRDGVNIHYEIHGSGPALLLTHGYSSTSAMWQGQVAALSKRHTLILWDMRGHGQSDYPDDAAAYSEALTVGDMAALLDKAGANSAIIGGLSLGGYMSLAFYRAHPQRVVEVVAVLRLGGVEEGEVVGPGETGEDLERRALMDADPRAEAGALEPLPRGARVQGRELDGVEVATGGQRPGHPDPRVAEEGAHLEHPPCPAEGDEQGEQPALLGRHLDLRPARGDVAGELLEQGVLGPEEGT